MYCIRTIRASALLLSWAFKFLIVGMTNQITICMKERICGWDKYTIYTKHITILMKASKAN